VQGGAEKCIQSWSWKASREDYSEDIGRDGRIMLKFTLGKQGLA
jgi:hypothetical protein